MGFTPTEFKKTLFGQFHSNTPLEIEEIDGNSWSIKDPSASISLEVRIENAPPRKLSTIVSLPVLNTEFTFIEITDIQQKEFMRTFFKYFHKGGG